MGQVSITIRGRNYKIACDDGQEAHLARLGRYLDQRAAEVAGSTGSVSDSMLLVMVGLMVADELADTTAELESVTGEGGQAAQAAADKALADSFSSLAKKIEDIAARLEGT